MNRIHGSFAALCCLALLACASAQAESIRREIVVDQDPAVVWDAVRDFGAVHKRLVPGFVTDTKLEPDARVVTFANGSVARELLVDSDENRAAWFTRSSVDVCALTARQCKCSRKALVRASSGSPMYYRMSSPRTSRHKWMRR